MGTLVQSPDLVQSTVTGAQTAAKPVERGLGAFLTDLIPVAQEGVQAYSDELKKREDAERKRQQKYQEDSRARLVALGRNDVLNQTVREVSAVDTANYSAGRTYQKVVNTQVVLAQEYQQFISSMDGADFNPEVAMEKGREFLDRSVDNIFESDLPSELKEELYQAQLKENATYMTQLDKRIQQITADNAANTRMNATAELTRNLGTTEYTANELGVVVESFFEKRVAALRLADPEREMSDIHTEVAGDLKAAFKRNLETLRTNGSAEDLQRLAFLSGAAEKLADLGFLDVASEIQSEANTHFADIQDNQVARRRYEAATYVNSWRQDPSLATSEVVQGLIGDVMSDESIPYQERQAISKTYLDAATTADIAITEAEVVLNPRESSVSAYLTQGKSESAYGKDVLASFIKEYPTQPAMGALQALNHFNAAAEYSPTGVKESSKVLFNTLIGYTRMSDADVAGDDFSDVRLQQFELTKQLYNRFRGENMSKAYDMLAGLPDEHIDAFTTAFETDKSLEDVRRMFQDPVTTEAKFSAISTVSQDVASITEALDLRKEVLGGHGGTRTRSMSDGLEPLYGTEVALKLQNNQAYFAGSSTTISTPKSLIAKYIKAGGLLPSQDGYSSAVLDLNVAKQVQGWKVPNTNTPLGTQYLGTALDVAREKLAKRFDVKAENIQIVSDATGQQMFFKMYESAGWRGQKEGSLKATGAIPLAALKKDAETLYRMDSKRKQSLEGQSNKYTNTQVGKAVIADHNTGKQSTVKINAHFARGMGGNPALATRWVNHMARMEGFVANRTQTKDANTGRVSYVYGLGATSATAGRYGMEKEFIAAQGNAQKTMDVQGKFMSKYYQNMPRELKTLGIPAPKAGAYSAKWIPSLMLAYDVKWHAGTTGRTNKGRTKGLIDAMNAPSYREGRRILQGLSTYNRKNLGSKRNRFMEQALQSHFRARGVK
ncbi:structural protein [Vibrio phage vB_VhaP_VH-5]|uniref:Structural protein n=1 Tax=Vibrio phage vB_VhaP_VH-5 TaxID=2660694 RepID=A0A5Q2WBY9_9CAUD|nr:structural protein [Vibrio phage vB_VhaP_VH-5]